MMAQAVMQSDNLRARLLDVFFPLSQDLPPAGKTPCHCGARGNAKVERIWKVCLGVEQKYAAPNNCAPAGSQLFHGTNPWTTQ